MCDCLWGLLVRGYLEGMRVSCCKTNILDGGYDVGWCTEEAEERLGHTCKIGSDKEIGKLSWKRVKGPFLLSQKSARPCKDKIPYLTHHVYVTKMLERCLDSIPRWMLGSSLIFAICSPFLASNCVFSPVIVFIACAFFVCVFFVSQFSRSLRSLIKLFQS